MSSEHSYVVLQVLEAFVLLELGGSQTLAHSVKCTHKHTHDYVQTRHTQAFYVQQHSLRINTNKLSREKSEWSDIIKPAFYGERLKTSLQQLTIRRLLHQC